MTISRLDNFLLFPCVCVCVRLEAPSLPPFRVIPLHYSISLAFPAFPGMNLRVEGNQRVRTARKREREREILEPRVSSRSDESRNWDRLFGSGENRTSPRRRPRVSGDAAVCRQARLEWRTKIGIWNIVRHQGNTDTKCCDPSIGAGESAAYQTITIYHNCVCM